MWRQMPQNHIKLFTSKKSKWFSRGFSPRSVRREAEYGTTASQTALLSYRPNNVQRAPWCTKSFRLPQSCSFFCFPFLLFLLTHSCPSQQRVETAKIMLFFFPALISIGAGKGGGDTYSWVQEEGKRRVRRFWRGHERVSKEKQKKSQRRSDYCCRERMWVTSLSRRKDKQVINAAGCRQERLRLRTSSGFCSAHRNNTVQQPSQSRQTLAHIWASAQPLMKETKSRALNYDAWASLRFGLLQITH